MVSPAFLLVGLLVPALVAGAALFVGWRSRRVGALGLGVGFLVGFPAVVGAWPTLPPRDGTQALFYVALGVTLAAWFEGRRRGASSTPLFPPRVVIAFLVPLLVLSKLIKHWEPTESVRHVSVAAAALLTLWTGADALAERRKGASLPLVFWLAATVASASLLVSGVAVISQLAGTLAATLGAAVVASWLRPELSFSRGPIAVPAALLAALCIGGVHLAELPPLTGLLLVLAPLAAWFAELGPLSRLPARRAVLVRLAFVALPLALAFYLAWLERAPPNPYADYY
jgi:hypothetical protein